MYWDFVVAAIASMILGMLWYSPSLFGNLWMKESGVKPPKKKKGQKCSMTKPMILNLITTVITLIVLSNLMAWTGMVSMIGALQLAVILWVGFYMTSGVTAMLWNKQSANLFLINQGYNLVGLLISAAILVAI